MVKKKFASSPREKRVPFSAILGKPLTEKQRQELIKLAARPDSEIDFSDIPELDESFFKNAVRNPFWERIHKK